MSYWSSSKLAGLVLLRFLGELAQGFPGARAVLALKVAAEAGVVQLAKQIAGVEAALLVDLLGSLGRGRRLRPLPFLWLGSGRPLTRRRILRQRFHDPERHRQQHYTYWQCRGD